MRLYRVTLYLTLLILPCITIAHSAAKSDSYGIGKSYILSEYGEKQIMPADPETVTPLMQALKAQAPFYEVRELIRNEKNINAQDSNGNTALHYSAFYMRNYLTQDDNLQIEMSQIRGTNKPSFSGEKNKYGTTTLMLLFNGADLLLKNKNGQVAYSNIECDLYRVPLERTFLSFYHTQIDHSYKSTWYNPISCKLISSKLPLHKAIVSQDTEQNIIALINSGIDVNQQDRYGNTPLHYATALLSPEKILIALIANGADPSIKNKLGNRPKENVSSSKFPKIADLLAYPKRYRTKRDRGSISSEDMYWDNLFAGETLFFCMAISAILLILYCRKIVAKPQRRVEALMLVIKFYILGWFYTCGYIYFNNQDFHISINLLYFIFCVSLIFIVFSYLWIYTPTKHRITGRANKYK